MERASFGVILYIRHDRGTNSKYLDLCPDGWLAGFGSVARKASSSSLDRKSGIFDRYIRLAYYNLWFT